MSDLQTDRPSKQLAFFIDKFDEEDRKLIRSVRSVVRKRLPTANELVYDNYNFLVIGYSPTERPSDTIISITARAGAVGICFIQGAVLPDPKNLLRGSGNQTRFIRLESAEQFQHPDVEAILAAAIERSTPPLTETGRSKLIIRSISEKQRPRRKSP